MPARAKNSENMTKHATNAQKDARAQAERGVLPDRGGRLRLRKPPFVAQNAVANRYWNAILRSMEGLVLLDDLDSEMLAGYCAMLARRDQTILLINQLMQSLGVSAALAPVGRRRKQPPLESMTDAEFEASAGGAPAAPAGMDPEEIIEAVSKLDTLNGKLQTLDRNVLAYADKLGLTPSGRVHLAQKRAEQAAVEPDGDLFGD